MSYRHAVYAAFVLSGIAGLIYEVIWTRYLGLLVGHSAYAQVIVLTIFLGGMGAGAWLVGRRSTSLADPLRWYARVEIVIALLGAAFDPVFRWLMRLAFDTALPAVGGGVASLGVTWTIAALAILPQSVLLGTTFPLITAGLLRREPAQPGRSLAILYFTNSAGAALGVLAGGFWLIPLVGLPGTLLVAAGLNAVAGVGALMLAGARPIPAVAVEVPQSPGSAAPDTPRVARVLLWVAFGTAVASFLYEVAWIRMLALLIGGATHAFELMLAAFILGLALGAFWVRSRADRWNAIPALGFIQIAMGVAALVAVPVYAQAFDWMIGLMGAFARSDTGYAWFAVARFAVCLAIMLPATFCAGMTLPLITRALLERGVGEGAIGRVYGVNTAGSIAGVIVAGLVLVPLIGLKHTLVAGAAVDIGFGALVLLTLRAAAGAGRVRYGAPLVGGALLVLAILTPNFDRQLVTSGVYRDGVRPPPAETLFYQDGRTATVTAFRPAGFGLTVISTNGKPDASLPDAWKAPCTADTPRKPVDSDVATQTLAPLIALAHAPHARRAAVIGLGSGISSHILLGARSVERLTTIEIEPAMARGARAFLPANRRAYDDPRSELIFDDARAYFAARPDRFDLIFSEPSNPWVSGVSSLFTTEFYGRVAQHLAEGGVFGQWLHLYELNDELVLSVLAAIHANFRSYAVFQAWEADLLIVAGNAPALPAPDWSVVDSPGLAADLCHTLPLAPAMLDAARLIDRQGLEPLLEQWGGPNSDYYPVLDLGAERARFLRRSARGFAQLAAARFDLAAALEGRVRGPAADTLAPVPRIPRMQALALAATLRTPGRAALPPGDARSRARHARDRWAASLAEPNGPGDWAAWLGDFTTMESLVHGAVQGTADIAFYAAVERFLDRWAAPPGVRDVVALRRAAAAWDFPAAVERSTALIEGVLAGEYLMSPDDLLDIAVTARLRTGDAAGARTVFERLLPHSTRRPDDLRLLLLGAHVLRAGGGEGAGGAAR